VTRPFNAKEYADGFRVIVAEIPRKALDSPSSYVVRNLDGIGDAIFVPIEDLSGVISAEAF
jgi:hypothetical protein